MKWLFKEKQCLCLHCMVYFSFRFFLKLFPVLFCRVVKIWRTQLPKNNSKVAQSLADPTDYENLFPSLKETFKAEQFLGVQRQQPNPARNYKSVTVSSTSLLDHRGDWGQMHVGLQLKRFF